MYKRQVVEEGNAEQIPISEFDLDERVIASFNLNSSWITNNKSFVTVKMGDTLIKKKTLVKIK